ncbi:MAG: hypothetical protein JF888_07665 [Candidatus Dormibacteraeota bacterium]|uniref:Uncharacterized protein n=1 Tax=Candidatus Dormiibacter inghamiae TaxID=3127013 RepID=A0A934N6Y6_9BACT|nr:hypothetical protein [Candidatus Dormibacteraeota bacterium]
MEILEAFDLTRSYRSAAELSSCDPKTVAQYLERRDTGYDPYRSGHRPRLVDAFAEKIEELVDLSHGKVRAVAGKAHRQQPVVDDVDPATRRMRRRAAGFPSGKSFDSWRETGSSTPGCR